MRLKDTVIIGDLRRDLRDTGRILTAALLAAALLDGVSDREGSAALDAILVQPQIRDAPGKAFARAVGWPDAYLLSRDGDGLRTISVS